MRFRKTGHPVLYEINTRVWLAGMPPLRGRPRTLAEVPEEELDRIAGLGFDLVWLMGVWPGGPRGVEIARAHPGLDAEYRRALPDLSAADVVGSPYSIAGYRVSSTLGGPGALAELRERLAAKGMGLVLDFVPNHTGVDHPWVRERPELFVQGDEEDLARSPGDFFAVDTAGETSRRRVVLAHGKDPYFPGWTDTAQVNWAHPELREAMRRDLVEIAGQCDGVRCDMAMLVLEPVYGGLWGSRAARALGGRPIAAGEPWPELIAAARARTPGFLFIAESYWDLEARLLELGFDYAYDKTLYERLVEGGGRQVRERLEAGPGHQRRLVRFLENHDEPRAAAALPPDRYRAAALIAATVPGMALFHEGQLEGRKLRLPVQLGRQAPEPVDEALRSFYAGLLHAVDDPILRGGTWRLLEPAPAWEGNASHDGFVAHAWETERGGLRVVAVNLSPEPGQCYLRLGRPDLEGRRVELRDLLGGTSYEREGSGLASQGLYLDLPPWGRHFFEVVLHAAGAAAPRRAGAPAER